MWVLFSDLISPNLHSFPFQAFSMPIVYLKRPKQANKFSENKVCSAVSGTWDQGFTLEMEANVSQATALPVRGRARVTKKYCKGFLLFSSYLFLDSAFVQLL